MSSGSSQHRDINMRFKNVMKIAAIVSGLLWTQVGAYLIETNNGALRGRRTQAPNGKYVLEFLGVPFAKPPLGELRFKYPLPVEPWNGTKDAVALPNSCVQRIDPFLQRVATQYMETIRLKTSISEDCLYLNIWIPDGANKTFTNMPVMLFFYGGAYVFGTISADGYDGGVFATEGNVIVVTANYRLSSLGFLSLDDKEVPGNAALLDQQMAMRWVSENVAHFGGDPKRVTLYGQSSRAASVNYHLLMPSSWDYFQGAILQSGFMNSYWALADRKTNDEKSWKIAEFLDCKKKTVRETVKCLQGVDAEAIIKNEPVDGYDFLVFKPVVDGVYLKDDPLELYRRGEVKPCNLITGTNRHDGSLFLPWLMPEDISTRDPKPSYEAIRKLIGKAGNLGGHPSFIKIVEYLYTGLDENRDSKYNVRIMTDIMNDVLYVCRMKELLQPYFKLNKENKSKIYTYLFSYKLSWLKNPDWMGVSHATDLPITFGHALNNVRNQFHEGSVLPKEVTFTKRILRYYANFARTGNPSISPSGKMEDISWPEHSENNEEYLILAPNSTTVGLNYRTKTCNFHNKLLPQLIKLAQK